MQTIESTPDQWKRFGIYIPGAPTSLTDFIVYVLDLTDRHERSVYYYKGQIIDARAVTDNSVNYNETIYNRLEYNSSEMDNAQENKKGKSDRLVFIGNSYVFKSANNKDTSLSSIMAEVSRNLIAISKGVNHALCFGILYNKNIDKNIKEGYYMVEEALNMSIPEKLLCNIKHAIANNMTELATDFFQYVVFFHRFVYHLQQADIGGDFKLDNLGFRIHKHAPDMFPAQGFIGTDIILPSKRNAYLPMSWNEWAEVARRESGCLEIYINPLSRLYYKECAEPVIAVAPTTNAFIVNNAANARSTTRKRKSTRRLKSRRAMGRRAK